MDVAGECEQVPGEAAPQLVERISSWMCSDPDSVAVETPCARVTYRRLAGRVVVLAGALKNAGIEPKDRVAIRLPVGDLQITAVLAGYLLGATIIVIDPNQHQRRLTQVMTDSAPAAVVGDLGQVSSAVAARHTMTTSTLDALVRRADASSPEELDLSQWGKAGGVVEPSAPMYLVYTSGSTGAPKGVVVPRRCIDALTTWQVSQSIPRPRTLQFAAPSFDVFHQEWTSTLAAGGTLIVPPASCRLDPHLLVQFLRAHAIERVFLPFVALQALCDAAEGAWLPALREVITAGERLVATQSVRSFFAANPNASLTNQYGPSETHVVTAHTLPSAPSDWPDLPPIGVAIDRSSVLVLTPGAMSPVSVGEVGELVVYGDSLAQGYRNDEQLTREKFPTLSAVDGSPRGYRTGDLVRCDGTGLMHFVGRIDDQVKISGHRVELGEVDAALMALRGVRAAAATVNRAGTTSVLVGYLVGDDPCPDAEVRVALAAVLPPYSIPKHFEWIEQLPKTSSGKVDRSRLTACSPRQTSGAEAMDTTGRVVRDVLQRQHVAAEENLLALGAQSLDLARISAEIFRQTGRRVAVSAVLEDPTIRGLRRALRNAAPWTRTEQRFPRPLNRLEQGVWIDYLSRPLDLSYNHGLFLSSVDIPTSLMDSAIALLQERHPILCSRTRVVGGTAVFEPASPSPPKHLPTTAVDDELIARALVGQPFNLADEAPVRFVLRVSDGLCRTLVVVAHHVALDGGGVRVLVDELSAALAGSRRPAPLAVELPAPLDEDLLWWTENLSGIRCAAPLRNLSPEAPTVIRSRPVCRSVCGGACGDPGNPAGEFQRHDVSRCYSCVRQVSGQRVDVLTHLAITSDQVSFDDSSRRGVQRHVLGEGSQHARNSLGARQVLTRHEHRCLRTSSVGTNSAGPPEEASVLHAALDASREFFRRPKHERARFTSDDYNHGYRPLGKEYSITPERPDLNECFTLWSDRSDLIPNGDDALELTQALVAWRSVLLPKISAVVGAVAERFDGAVPTCEAASYMQVNHYGALGDTERELLQDRHEDGHLITCLHATDEGLEAFVDDQAVPTGTADDEILLMAGSVLSQLTGGEVPPLYHQVRNHGVQNRLSLMYFVNPELGEPIPSWVDPSTDLRDAVRTNPSMFGLPDVPEL